MLLLGLTQVSLQEIQPLLMLVAPITYALWCIELRYILSWLYIYVHMTPFYSCTGGQSLPRGGWRQEEREVYETGKTG